MSLTDFLRYLTSIAMCQVRTEGSATLNPNEVLAGVLQTLNKFREGETRGPKG